MQQQSECMKAVGVLKLNVTYYPPAADLARLSRLRLDSAASAAPTTALIY